MNKSVNRAAFFAGSARIFLILLAICGLIGAAREANAQSRFVAAPGSGLWTTELPTAPAASFDLRQSPALMRFELPRPRFNQSKDPVARLVAQIVLNHLPENLPMVPRPNGGLDVCFAPGTDPAYVRAVERLLETRVWRRGPLAPGARRANYEIGGRWSRTAKDSTTGTRGNPIRLTYSFVPDGLNVAGYAGEADAPSELQADLTAFYGSVGAWKARFASYFALWQHFTGISYEEVSDDGEPFADTDGQLGARGDCRISAHPIDVGGGILAYNFFPNTSDMVIDSNDFVDQFFFDPSDDFRFFRNVVTHEHGHGLALNHSVPDPFDNPGDPDAGTKLMEPFINLSFNGPQDDDIRGAQRNYGDPFENNDTAVTATDFGATTPVNIDTLSTDSSTDQDYFRMAIPANSRISVTISPIGSAYRLGSQDDPTNLRSIDTKRVNRLNLEVLGTNGATVLTTQAAANAGDDVTISNFSLPSSGTFFLRVSNVATGVTDDVQRYTLSVVVTRNPVSLDSVSVSPVTVPGGVSATGTVTLTDVAPAGGTIVALSSDTPAVASVPAAVTVPAGQARANFSIITTPVSTPTPVVITGNINGATRSATLTVVPIAPARLVFAPNPVKGGVSSTGTVTLNGPAPVGGTTVNLSSANSAVVSVPANVTVAAGATTADFTATTSSVTDTTDVVVTASNAAGSSNATLTVFAIGVASVSLNPTTVRGGATSTGTVTLTDAAPSGGATVTLSATPSSAASVPATVSVASGATTATFTVTASVVAAPTDAIITATLNRISKTATLRITPPTLAGLSLNPTSVRGGVSSTGTVTLDGAAPTGGLTVTLSSANASIASVPASVSIAGGQTSATFTVSTRPVAGTTDVLLTATSNGVSKTAMLRITPPGVSTLTVNPSSVYGGAASTGTVTLAGPAPSSGLTITLSSSNTAAATLPASVTVGSGRTSATFTISTRAVSALTSVTISATAGGQTRTATLRVVPSTVRFLTLNPSSVRGGVSSTGTVTLTGPAPTGGATVALSSSNTAVAQTPASVVVRAGQTAATFTVTTRSVTSVQYPAIRATLNGTTKSATLTVSPTNLSALSVSPDTVVGTVSATGLVRLDGPAPEGGLTVTLASSNPSVAGVPTTVTVPAGLQTKTFTIITSAVTARTQVTITARAGSVTVRALLTVDVPQLRSLTILNSSGNPVSTIAGGNSLVGKVEISNPAPAGGIVVTLSSSNPAVVIPASVTILAGQTSATFIIGTARVFDDTPVVLTAKAGGVTVTASLTVQPLRLSSLTLLPSTVLGGNSSLAIVMLNGPAPQGGVRVSLQSSSQDLTAQPSFIVIPAGATMSSVYILTQPVNEETDVTITATASFFGRDPVSQTATLTITPPTLVALTVSPTGVHGGQSAQGTVALSGLASFAQVTLTSSNPAVVRVPPFVYVFPGSTTGFFDVQTSRVTTSTTVTITATYNGSTRTTTIRVNP